MEPQPDVGALAALIKQQPREVAEELLRVLRDRVEGPARPSVERLTGIVVKTVTGEVRVSDSGGAWVPVPAGVELVIVPQVLAAPTPTVADGALAAHVSTPITALHVTIAAGAASRISLDLSGLLDSVARWGPLRVVARRHLRGKVALELAPRRADITLAADEEVVLFATAISVKIDPARVFRDLAHRREGGR